MSNAGWRLKNLGHRRGHACSVHTVIVSIRNDRGEEIAHKLIGLGAMLLGAKWAGLHEHRMPEGKRGMVLRSGKTA